MPDKQPHVVSRIKEQCVQLFERATHPQHPSEATWLQQLVLLWQLTVRCFVQNRLPVRAASLSYTTILALVPLLAVVVGITSSLLKGESEDRIGQFVEQMVDTLVPPGRSTNTAGSVSRDLTATNGGKGEPTMTNSSSSSEDSGGIIAPIVGSDTNASTALTGKAAASNLTNTAATVAGEMSNTNSAAASDTEKPALNEGARARVVRQIKGFIDNTRSGTLGLTGSAAIIFLAISMLIRIEDAFNDIWGVHKGRSLFMRLVLYWTVISLAPIILIVGIGMASGPHLEATQHIIGKIPLVGWLLFQMLPILVLALGFGAFYILMPNTSVRWQAALVGGAVAAVLWHANSSLSALYVSRVVTNSKIYGSLGLVPVFMVGLYFAWMILLLGGQVSYAWQNRLSHLQEQATENVNQRGREFVALRLMTAIGTAYHRGEVPPGAGALAESLSIPARLAQEVLGTLGTARLLTEVNGPEAAFVPARPLETISCHDVLHAMRSTQGVDVAAHDEPVQRKIYGEFERINDAERKAAESVSMLDLARRSNALGAGATTESRELAAGETEEA